MTTNLWLAVGGCFGILLSLFMPAAIDKIVKWRTDGHR